jgi:hypothetical protein
VVGNSKWTGKIYALCYSILRKKAVGSDRVIPSVELRVSVEADVWPADDPVKADLIDGCIGEMSPFHDTFGYYTHGIGPETAKLPKFWKKR